MESTRHATRVPPTRVHFHRACSEGRIEGSGTGRVLGALAARKGYNSGGGGVAYSSAARVLPRGAIWLGDFGGEAACFSRNCAIGPCDIELKAKTAFSLVRGSA